MRAEEGHFDAFDPANIAPAMLWLASPLGRGVSGQVLKVQGGLIQAVEGWRPVTQITSETPWTAAEIAGRRGELFPDGTAIPPFFFTLD